MIADGNTNCYNLLGKQIGSMYLNKYSSKQTSHSWNLSRTNQSIAYKDTWARMSIAPFFVWKQSGKKVPAHHRRRVE